MAGESDDLDKLFESVADGESVDWDALERAAPDDETRARLRELRLIAEVAEVHRSQVDEVPGPDAAATVPVEWPVPAWPPPPRRPPAGTVSGTDEGANWGHLLLVRKIGEGSYGEVYQAHDTWLDHPVALKLLKPEAESRVQPSDLLHEARKLARVRHSNVVNVHGADRHDGRVGFWMEFIDGETLAARIAKGSMSSGEAASVGQEVCRALAAVHRANIIHRDVKAQNVMRAHDGGRIILMDFGAGQFTDDPSLGKRAQGTPLYLAPEVLGGEDATVRSDIYAAGVLLFHLVTGRFPVEGASPADLIEAHTRGRRRRLRDERPDLPESFVTIVERAIDPDPQRRYGSAGEMEAKLSGEENTDRIDRLRRIEPRPDRSVPKQSPILVGASAIGATALFLTLVGAITSQFYYAAFGLTGNFQQETWLLWPVWGLRALLAPVVLAGGAVAVAVVLGNRTYRFAVELQSAQRVVRPLSRAVSVVAQSLRSLPTATTAGLLLLTQVSLWALTWWWFAPLLGGLDTLILQTSGGDLSPLSPANAAEQRWFRQVVSLEFVVLAALWFVLVRERFRRHESGGWVSIAAGIAMMISILILLVAPYRILSHNEHERVSHRSETCYFLADRGNDALLFCPLQMPTRNRVVRLDDPALERGGAEENMFTPLVTAVN